MTVHEKAKLLDQLVIDFYRVGRFSSRDEASYDHYKVYKLVKDLADRMEKSKPKKKAKKT